MSEQNLNELLKQGIELAREGKKAEARKLFEQVTELDDQNEKGWYWLASVVESDEERRICLSNVLLINPGNERAQQLMAKLDSKAAKAKSEEEVMPGITRRQLMIFGGGGIAIVLLAVIVLIAVAGGQQAQVAAQTQEAINVAAAATSAAVQATTDAANATATQLALATPTFTPTSTLARATLPPAFTPTDVSTLAATQEALPAPVGIPGRIVSASGVDISQIGYLPITIFQVDGGQTSVLPDIDGRDPVFSPDGSRVAYTRYTAVTYDYSVGQSDVGGNNPVILSQGHPVLKSKMPSYCAAGNIVAFVALPTGTEIDFSGRQSEPFQVFTLNLDTNQLTRLTNDKVTYLYPALSPDCTRVAVVKNDELGAQPGPDIVVIDIASLTQTAVTTDFGNFVESRLSWTPDGTQILYAAYQVGQENNNNIVVRPPDPNATPLVLINDPSNDIDPVFSPDGRYLAFSSNRSGQYDIYILSQTDNTLYQLTNSPDDDHPGGWAP